MTKREPNQKNRIVEWWEIEQLSTLLSTKLKKELKFNSIFGIPRGGMVVAVFLSHRLSIPVVENNDITPNTLIVDDITDSGQTLQNLEYSFKKKFPDKEMTTVVLFQRKGTIYEADFVGEEILDNSWLQFPWELENE